MAGKLDRCENGILPRRMGGSHGSVTQRAWRYAIISLLAAG